MYLPFIKPDCVFEIIMYKTCLILKLRQPDVILERTFKRVIGRQKIENYEIVV